MLKQQKTKKSEFDEMEIYLFEDCYKYKILNKSINILIRIVVFVT